MRGIEQIPWLYEIICSLCEWSGLGAWRRWLVGGARGQVLDLGSGTGRNLPLLPAGTRAVALDPSLDSLKRARRRAPAVPLVAGRAEALPFRDATFDTVLSGLVFCSVGEPRRGLAEVERVLRPDGQLRMLEHVRSVVRWRARLQDLIQPVWTRVSGGCHPNRDTEATVERGGFRIESEGRMAKGPNRRFVARIPNASP
jgi:ubiquinone/menaquinone biosynthesis C-methylase UbiE